MILKKPDAFPGFLIFYFGLIALCLCANLVLFHESLSLTIAGKIALSVSQASLTGFNGNAFNISLPVAYHVFSLIITQLSGILFLSYLLRLYWKLVKSNESNHNLSHAFWLTLKVSFIAELSLTLFFLYALPIESAHSNLTLKIIAALTLAIHSFNNAGLPLIDTLLTSNTIQQNVVIQIGIIGGGVLGSLGIFVIYELLSPLNLRRRLRNPEIDWSLNTKLSVFGATFILLFFSIAFYLVEYMDKNAEGKIVESAIASVFEISSSRGFGYSLFYEPFGTMKLLASVFGAGIFSTGSGFTLILLLIASSTFFKDFNETSEMNVLIHLGKILFKYVFISFGFLSIITFVLIRASDNHISFNELWLIFSTNHVSISSNEDWYVDFLKSIAIIAGRIGFVVACFLTISKKIN